MNSKVKLKNSIGSTLIELLIAATITVIVMTAIAISMMYSIQREAQNRYQESAVMLAQNVMDLMMKERAEKGWDGFFSHFGSGTKCLNANGDNIVTTPCPSLTFGGLAFTAKVESNPTPPNKVDLTITVDWTAGQNASQYQLKQAVYKGIY